MSSTTVTRMLFLALAIGLTYGGLNLAGAAPALPVQPVREQNLDTNGLIRTHEQGTANVNVTNAAVPVSGTITVGNTPSVKIDPGGDIVAAGQSGSWSVGIDPSANTVKTVAADNPAFQHDVQVFERADFADGVGGADSSAFTVPSGEKLVIEQVSFRGELPNGENFSSIQLIPDEDLKIGPYFYPAAEVPATATETAITGSELTRVYVEESGTVRFEVARYPATGTGSISCIISGYLVDIP